ncbi:hypothetical protein DSM3645_03058 [Blastopirellula marina DSM 3645]|uniref:Uncharacterized protein n=1 Tax=Blastopirellula marina DSM 3645 TaxID=314230 RepID=A3ZVS5_9BACT|nr:hypothetical protein DSM3645_03058 [Blastopirellula marina DSM 3645]
MKVIAVVWRIQVPDIHDLEGH